MVGPTRQEASPNIEPSPTSSRQPIFANWLIVLLAFSLIITGGYARMVQLWPQSKGISQLPYDDEGVYAGASQLFLHGILPYRDYFSLTRQ